MGMTNKELRKLRKDKKRMEQQIMQLNADIKQIDGELNANK